METQTTRVHEEMTTTTTTLTTTLWNYANKRAEQEYEDRRRGGNCRLSNVVAGERLCASSHHQRRTPSQRGSPHGSVLLLMRSLYGNLIGT